jgi:hypothetical protein
MPLKEDKGGEDAYFANKEYFFLKQIIYIFKNLYIKNTKKDY